MNDRNDHRDDQSDAQEGELVQRPPCKLDLRYFTTVDRCPGMVRHRSRRSFELFLFLAHQFLLGEGEPVAPAHEELCDACGLEPETPHTRSYISHALRRLRETYQVIEYEPVQRRRPRIRLRPIKPGEDPLDPTHYIYFRSGWSGRSRGIFTKLGNRAFAAEYMYLIAEYESALARVKHGRLYWFYPMERLAQTFHISRRFASVGLQALVDLGVMRISYGRRDMTAPGGEFGRANRYYFDGLGILARREEQLQLLKARYGDVFEMACELSAELTNGATVKNVEGLCDLLAVHGEKAVRRGVGHLSKYRRSNPRRRLAYVQAIVTAGFHVKGGN
jgi:hypothetical protein